MRYRVALVGLLISACTRHNPAVCNADTDCTDPARPFCDVNGEFPESGHEPNTCTVTPASCPIARCGCTAGASLACSVDQLTVCNPDGHSTATVACALGCATGEPRCLIFDPSNGLGPALTQAAAAPAVILPPGARIDTELGLVQDAGGAPIEVPSIVISQAGGQSMIRAFIGASFVIDNVSVTGAFALAVVAPGSITIRGRLDASATGRAGGPAAQEAPALCAGTSAQRGDCGGGVSCGNGAGGAGNATIGGTGGGRGTLHQGGASAIGASALVGGCRGGQVTDVVSAALVGNGGAGGGAVQLVSGTQIEFSSGGMIDVGGGGGNDQAGGGSGGLVILEAPRVRIDGATTGVTANGGSGGGCGADGVDGTNTTSPALGATCDPFSAGGGGTGSVVAQSGQACTTTCVGISGGGGGAVGTVRIATKDGTYETVANPVLSAVITTGVLVAR